MGDFSPAALEILTALTQDLYSLDPADVPLEARRMAGPVAAALRCAANQIVPEQPTIPEGDLVEQTYRWDERSGIRAKLLSIAVELERFNRC